MLRQRKIGRIVFGGQLCKGAGRYSFVFEENGKEKLKKLKKHYHIHWEKQPEIKQQKIIDSVH